MTLRMTKDEREEFLAALHVGVLSVARDSAGPLAVPVWYTYQPGGPVSLSTGATSAKARAIAAAGRFTLTVQDEQPPYKYVTVEGPATTEPASLDDRLQLARRYLGTEGGDAFVAANPGDDNILIRLTPDHWLTADFGKEYP
jgi:PPOX class probable F420-dependent enzyme